MSQVHRDAGAAACRTIIVTNHCPPIMRKRDIWRVDQFHLLRKVGSGYASTVYLGTCRTSGNQVAVKLYHKQKLSELNHFQVAREITIHSSLDHKNIIQMWAAFEDQYGIYLVFEYASKGDVFTEVERRGGQLDEAETVRSVVYPFLSALDYLHSRCIIHRDIKPENLLFTATGVLKVADFGLSINFSQERPVTRVGTLDYMAPEVVVCPDKHRPQDHKELKHLHYTPLVDAWAVGVLAYELIVGRPPFDKGQKKATIAEILNGEPFVPPWLSEGATHFIRWSLTKEVGKRPSVQQLAEHPWIVSHMKQSVLAPARRQLVKTDSFVEPRQLGFRGSNAPGAGEPSGPTKEPPRPLQVSSVAQGGRFLGHSNSMSAMDGMRYRDIHLDSVTGGMASAATEALKSVKRVSDGDGTTGGRPSAAGGRVSRAGTARNSGTGQAPLSRMNSMSAQAVVAAAAAAMASGSFGGGAHGSEDSPKGGRALTREELYASLTAPLGGRGSPVLARSFTAGRASPAPQQMAPLPTNAGRKSGGGGLGSAGSSLSGQAPGASPSRGAAELAHDLSRLRVDSGASGGGGAAGPSTSASGAMPYSPGKSSSGIRPSPPQAPSPTARGLRTGSPLIPSRLSQSFTSPVSPLAIGSNTSAGTPHLSRLGKTSNSGIVPAIATASTPASARTPGGMDAHSSAAASAAATGATNSPRHLAAAPAGGLTVSTTPGSPGGSSGYGQTRASPRELPGERDPELEDSDEEEEPETDRSPSKSKSLFKKIFS
ncbi:hypothetical protein HXX76_004731 [Chlamydomonas incerta]|uniref:Aurora kinase n=1 Tax=Chlamydomonas incerta TaxID=51695 RepID=A0A835T5U2_CHLIN|nr:hypothetical protein HXX76_004731 [Chlamydomonas incerta]|eukprot:KAG2439374.1 hypothetical protein HXX76_004731 [Chlamydomonas incerta]